MTGMISRLVGSSLGRNRRRRTASMGAVIALGTALILVAATSIAAAHSLKPRTITSLTLSPSSVSHTGGTVHLKAVIKHENSCKVSISPHLSGFPKSHSCSSGHLSISFHVGTAPSSAARHFTITLKATKGSHHVSKSVHLTQKALASAPAAAPTASSFQASPANLTSAGGASTLSATVAHASNCTLSVSPAVSGLPAAASCSGTAYSHQVTLPANASTTTAQTYTFTLSVTGSGGNVTASTHPTVTVAAAAAQQGGSSVQPITSLASVPAALPAGADSGASDDTSLDSVSCPAAGDCVAVGSYLPSASPYPTGVIETFDGTSWTAIAAPLPSNIYTGEPAVTLNSISCVSATSCVAVGEFIAESGGTELGNEPYAAIL